MMIVNGSPRAPRSNSKRYAQMILKHDNTEARYFEITKTNHAMLCQEIESCSDVLLVFPLYADGIPSVLLDFLKDLEKSNTKNRPVLSVLVNCGFIEWQQNQVAVEMVKLFCSQNGYDFGSALSIGSGEAILDTPFRFLVDRQIKKMVISIQRKEYKSFHTTMPLSKKMYIRAANRYWTGRGAKNGISRAEMEREIDL